MRWLSELQQKMDAVPAKYLILDGTIEPGERVVGRLPEDLLRLWGLHLQMTDELDDFVQVHGATHSGNPCSPSSCKKFFADLSWRIEQHRFLLGLFWMAVHHEFDLLTANIGIRAHGDVVTWKDASVQEKLDEVMIASEMRRAMHSQKMPN